MSTSKLCIEEVICSIITPSVDVRRKSLHQNCDKRSSFALDRGTPKWECVESKKSWRVVNTLVQNTQWRYIDTFFSNSTLFLSNWCVYIAWLRQRQAIVCFVCIHGKQKNVDYFRYGQIYKTRERPLSERNMREQRNSKSFEPLNQNGTWRTP